MPANNIVILRGQLTDDPYLEALANNGYLLRFQLAVQRDPSQLPRQTTQSPDDAFDVLRVVRYGLQAKLDYFYLHKGSLVVVMGWNQSRPIVERVAGKEVRRTLVEVNAQSIAFEGNVNYERGNRQRDEIMGQLSKHSASLPDTVGSVH